MVLFEDFKPSKPAVESKNGLDPTQLLSEFKLIVGLANQPQPLLKTNQLSDSDELHLKEGVIILPQLPKWLNNFEQLELSKAPVAPKETLDQIKKQLSKDVEKLLPDDEAKAFLANMDAFEKRAKASGLSDGEIEKTYQELIRLLTSKSEKLSLKEQEKIAEQLMAHFAAPTSINQGFNETCVAASLEARLCTTHPSDVAKLVVDVALHGKYTSKDGYTVDVPPINYLRNRDFASDIFETTAINVYYAHNKPPKIYKIEDPMPNQHPPDTGEHVIDSETGDVKPFHGMTMEAAVVMANSITGEAENAVLSNSHADDPGSWKKGIYKFGKEDDFESVLKNAKFPLQLRVNTNNEPFFDDRSRTPGGWHAICITAYHPGPPPTVEIDNQWGNAKDHLGNKSISLHELYLATWPPGSPQLLELMQADIDKQRSDQANGCGNVDIFEELDLLRQRRLASELYPDVDLHGGEENQYGTDVENLLKDAALQWSSLSDDKKKSFSGELKALIGTIPDTEERLKLYKEAYDGGFIDQAKFMAILVNEGKELWAERKYRASDPLESEQYQKEWRQLLADVSALPKSVQAEVKQSIYANPSPLREAPVTLPINESPRVLQPQN